MQTKQSGNPEGQRSSQHVSTDGVRPAMLVSYGTLFERVRRHFLAGILVIVPAFIALYVMFLMMNGAEAIFGDVVVRLFGLKPGDTGAGALAAHIAKQVLSLIMALFLVIAVGYFSTFFFIRRLIHLGENIVGRVPFVKFFYNTPKEVISTFAMSRNGSFERVVMVEYPRRGIWCLAFATGEVRRRPDNMRLVAVFMPTTPNPTSGFLMYLPPEDVLDTNIPMEQGARMIISGGILSPAEISTQKFTALGASPELPPLGPVANQSPTADPEAPAQGSPT